MRRDEVKQIFDAIKTVFFQRHQPSNSPTVYILGGQPSSGKSSLVSKISASGVDFLVINGDEYRKYHPNYSELADNPLSFSSDTQIFSNTFTEELIKESMKRKLNVSVEGTMRTPIVVTNTIEQFKQDNYNVELHCIIAPKEYTTINLYHRYKCEIEDTNTGRLADIDIHDKACEGLLRTLDTTYLNGVADKIRLYSIFGRNIVAEYTKDASGSWDNTTLPSDIVVKSRGEQLHDAKLAKMMLDRGTDCLTFFSSTTIQDNIQSAMDSIEANQENSHRYGLSR